MKQEQKVIEYFIQNNNEAKHFEQVAEDLNILVPNVRRILGQGTLRGIFNRVSVGIYEFAHYETKQDITIKKEFNPNIIGIEATRIMFEDYKNK